MTVSASISGQVSPVQTPPPPPPRPKASRTAGTALRAASILIAPAIPARAGNIATWPRAGAIGAGLRSRTLPASAAEPIRQPLGGLAKRAADMVLAGLLLLLAAPVMLLVAAAIRLLMGGPVVFGHARVGYGGRTFVCYKFRSMASNAKELLAKHLAENPEAAREWQATHKLANDPRVTPLGRLLRKTSLDELPQLFNVLIGDMSLIGPRPIVPDEIARYGRHAPAYFTARPGITGVWQTNGRSSVSYRTRVACDLYYARHWSLALDLKLLVRTVPAVLKFDQTS
jgi:exopolysaccharide production protein ExoY